MSKLMPLCLAPDWYHVGLRRMTQLMQQGGITTAADMLFGALDPDFELGSLDLVLEQGGAAVRMVNVFDTRAFANRAQGKKATGARTFWNAAWQIDVRVNVDAGMVSVLKALQDAQDEKPRFDHRFYMHHVGYRSAAQTDRIAALGAYASVNPYFLHALGDDYARVGLGPERASQITRCGSLVRAGVKVSFQSDFMMAPPEPLPVVAWWTVATSRANGGHG